MDVFLVVNGVVENIVSVKDMAQALELYPDYTIIERVEENRHTNIGDASP